MEIVFWICLFMVFYTYVGYGIVIFGILSIKRLFSKKEVQKTYTEWPTVTLLIPSYNEKDIIGDKIKNCMSLDYPKDKLNVVFVTDGSSDGTPAYIEQNSNYIVWHLPERSGKIAAMNRAMKLVGSPITIFCDANTNLNKEAVKIIVSHFANPKVGCVAGEKRVMSDENATASSTEGIYWKYESFLKKMDSELLTVVGAAGELFALRTELFLTVPKDTILDDFIISLRIAEDGYKVVYEPNAYAIEKPSADIREELKRKIRISAGGIQSIVRLYSLFNVFKHGLLTFQYVSHRVLRWTITPVCLFLLIPINVILAYQTGGIYTLIAVGQIAFYILAFNGWIMQLNNLKFKILFVPMYFTMMNVAVFLGMIRYFKGQQSVLWEKAQRQA